MQKISDTPSKYIRTLFFLSPFLAGLYYELVCALFSALLLVWLIIYGRSNKIVLRKNSASLAVAFFFAAYFITPLWAADHGLSLWGIAKALPVLLFSICLMQLDCAERRSLLELLPLMGCTMTIASCVLRYIPALADFFTINDRLGGFFQYPNTFACFLLLCMEALFFDERLCAWKRGLAAAILTAGFLQAGSRAAFVIGVVALAVCFICRKDKTASLTTIVGLVAGTAVSIVISALTATTATSHMLDVSAQASTFLGRLLYWKDALPIILKHPFGTGYLGYYFMQGTFQTGVYSVRWVHNDLLQILLDIGWISTALCLFALWRAFRSNNITLWQKILLGTLLAHALFDFDLAYIAMFFILLINLDWDTGKVVVLKGKTVWSGAAVLAVAFSLWIGTSSLLTTLGRDNAAVQLYPWNTFSQIRLLTQDTDISAFTERSNLILRQNPYSAVSWNAKVTVAWQQGDFAEVVRAKRKAIACNKYDINEYTDYLDKLLDGVRRYRAAGQAENAQLCIEEAQRIPQSLTDVKESSSSLAWKITDIPQLELPPEYLALLNELN